MRHVVLLKLVARREPVAGPALEEVDAPLDVPLVAALAEPVLLTLRERGEIEAGSAHVGVGDNGTFELPPRPQGAGEIGAGPVGNPDTSLEQVSKDEGDAPQVDVPADTAPNTA